MDELLREFLTETSESLDTIDNQLVRFEQDPNNARILDNIFRLVHTIKGTCGFLGLPRKLELQMETSLSGSRRSRG
jgi:two-component system, chemotaxis family, sensor kinase CheA